MRSVILTSILAAAIAAPALAQTPPATIGERYVPAPWWMREPVTASLGLVRSEVVANRAGFSASFQVIDRSGPEAMVQASQKVRELGRTLAAMGPDKVEIQTTFNMQPLYEQYKDKDGNLQTNARADKIERYAVQANLRVTLRDVSLLEKVYATVLAAKPTSTGQVGFSLDPTNEQKAWIFNEAVRDAARRARSSAEAAGAKLGAVKVIDPTARACHTDILAGWPSYGEPALAPTTVDSPAVAGYAPPPPPPAPMAAPAMRRRGDDIQPEDIQLPLQPPRQELTAEACVVYGLG
ncbi:MAG: SIMPL domain-containing protein [Proteobacteria bacterium]|nr:SIMPL domain-containing protein [Pseudomonadota bacterium]